MQVVCPALSGPVFPWDYPIFVHAFSEKDFSLCPPPSLPVFLRPRGSLSFGSAAVVGIAASAFSRPPFPFRGHKLLSPPPPDKLFKTKLRPHTAEGRGRRKEKTLSLSLSLSVDPGRKRGERKRKTEMAEESNNAKRREGGTGSARTTFLSSSARDEWIAAAVVGEGTKLMFGKVREQSTTVHSRRRMEEEGRRERSDIPNFPPRLSSWRAAVTSS